MKTIVSRCLALILVGQALIVTGFAQSDNKPELIDREKEIEMALGAAPEHLRKEAAVYVMQRGGYVKAREGSNGFTCLVEREGVKGTSPICFDREGSETTLLMVFRKMQLIEQGKEKNEVERVIDEEYRAGKLLAPRKQGVAYMLSTEFKTHDHKSGKMVTVFPPHVMFYAPYMKNSDIGARPEHRGSESQPWILNEGKPWAYIIVVPKEKQPSSGEKAIVRNNPTGYFEAFIGEWEPSEAEKKKNPNRRDFISAFEWDSRKRGVRILEGYSAGQKEHRVLEGFALWNPVTGRVEFHAYNFEADFLFKGEYTLLEKGKLQRTYEVHYPSDHEFAKRGYPVIKFRETCTLRDPDTIDLNITYYNKKDNRWDPWGDSGNFMMVRRKSK